MGNFLGAFADAAVLFPLLAILGGVDGFSPWIPMLSAGVVYVVAGWFFRVPMSVQPLKSIVIAGVAAGASAAEIRWSGALIGACALAVSSTNVEEWTSRIPHSIVHGVQAGLGLLLIGQGLKSLGADAGFGSVGWLAVAAAGLVLFADRRPNWPLLGALGTAALLVGLLSGGRGSASPLVGEHPARWQFVLSLVLPQLALTMSNSVVATQDVCRRYFAESARAVTPRRLLVFIGVGNIVTAALGGLPFCHGSGGVTAHFRGGARHWISGCYVGGFLIVLAVWALATGAFRFTMPPFLLAVLLTATGVFHMTLAMPTWNVPDGKFKLSVMAATAIATKNMLWVLAAGVLCESAARLIWGGKEAS